MKTGEAHGGGNSKGSILLKSEHCLVFCAMVLKKSIHFLHQRDGIQIDKQNSDPNSAGNKIELEWMLLNCEKLCRCEQWEEKEYPDAENERDTKSCILYKSDATDE